MEECLSVWDGSCLCKWLETGMRGLSGYKNNPECEWLEMGMHTDNNAGIK